ncbi:MAG TPA: ribonuclease D [Rhodospirillales bacterium]|nr:ribonuclease D [Rhodospirillales bacterium]
MEVHDGDLPEGLTFGDSIAIDTETLGLVPKRDRLCVVQISSGDGTAHLVKLAPGDYQAPNLKKLLGDTSVTKLFHYARFDVAIIAKYLDVICGPIYCTKIASKLARTYTDAHGLKVLCKELLGVELSKEQQSSYWGVETLSDEQIRYAASDVLYLHALRQKLDAMLEREGRQHLLGPCFDFIPTRCQLDLNGWHELDIFSH